MSAAPAPPEILDGGAGFPGGGPAADLRAVFGDLMRLHAEAAGIRAEARHRVPHDLDERLAGLARGLGRAAGRLSTSRPYPRAVRSGRHGHGHGWAALTPAELDVIRVVVAGRTNRQAAAQLFLSPHTVSSHLRHAYAKLGINSRVELVRAAVATDVPGQDL